MKRQFKTRMMKDLKGLEEVSEDLHLFDLVLATLALVAFGLALLQLTEVLTVTNEMSRLLEYIDLGICAFFFADFVKSFIKAPDRWHYMRTWGWFDLLSSIPVIAIPHQTFGQMPVVLRVIRLVRVLRAVRSVRVLSGIVRRDRSLALLTFILLVGIIIFVGGCIGVLWAENRPWLPPGVESKVTLKSAGDVLWWAVVTSSTVGYGDYSPVTDIGRIFAVGIMIVGIGSFATLTSALGILVNRFRRRGRDPLEEVLDRLNHLESMIARLEPRGEADDRDRNKVQDPGSD